MRLILNTVGTPRRLSDLICEARVSREVAKKEGLSDGGFRCEHARMLHNHRCWSMLRVLKVAVVLSWLLAAL